MCAGSNLPNIWVFSPGSNIECPPKKLPLIVDFLDFPMDFPLKKWWFSKVVKACQKAEVLREEAGQLGELRYAQIERGLLRS